jgi:hypothetical protein
MAQQTALMQVMSEIKEYVRSLNVPDNLVYQENDIIIHGCFAKSLEICNDKLAMEKEQIINAWIATDNELQKMAAEQYYNKTYGTE